MRVLESHIDISKLYTSDNFCVNSTVEYFLKQDN